MQVEVQTATNIHLNGMSGIILDESKFSFIVEKNGVQKRILKKGVVFCIDESIVFGDAIVGRIDQRIKRMSRK